MKHSERAKKGTTNEIKARLSFLQNTLKEREKTVKQIRSYEKYNLPGYKTTLSRELTGVRKIKKDISNLKVLIRKRQKLGQIFKVL